MNSRTLSLGLALGFGVYGLWQIATVAAVHGKAALAPHLIASAWSDTLTHKTTVRPWPWADTWPVAFVKWQNAEIAHPVLAGATGRTLAFAPGHLDGSAGAGEAGLMVISGHRDTHFTYLKHVTPGDRFKVQDMNGNWHPYRVTETAVVNATDRVAVDETKARVVLVTCWPFDAVESGGPLRYAVFAEHEDDAQTAPVISLATSLADL